MLGIILSCVSLVVIFFITGVAIVKGKQIHRDYNNKINKVVSEVNTANRSEYDVIKSHDTDIIGLRSDFDGLGSLVKTKVVEAGVGNIANLNTDVLNTKRGVNVKSSDPAGPLIQQEYGNNLSTRYGVGQFKGGDMKIYTAGDSVGKITFGRAKKDGTFDDVLTIGADRKTLIDGGLNMNGGIGFVKDDPGTFIEKQYSNSLGNRYGVGQFKGGDMKMYTASDYPGKLSFGRAKKDGTFDDVLTIGVDRKTSIDGGLTLKNGMNVSGAINMDDGINLTKTDPGSFIQKQYNGLGDRYGVGQFKGKDMKLYTSGDASGKITLGRSKRDGTFDDVITVNANRSTVIDGALSTNGPVKMRHTWGDWADKAPLSVWTTNGTAGASFGGPDNWSHFPWSDGSTYIRPGKKGGDVNIDSANNIKLAGNVVKVSNKLCIDDVCLTSADIQKLKSLTVPVVQAPAPVTQSQPVQNCEVSGWTGWTSCSKPCGGGTQTHTRTVTKQAANGGAACPVLSESQNCNTQACPVDCQVSAWSGWTSCDKPCGGGNQTRTRTVTQQAANGGVACPALSESQPCNTQVCPVQAPAPVVQAPIVQNCEVSAWSGWTSCSKPCGGGTQSRTRTVTKPAANGGTACPSLVETQACNTQACPVDCQVSGWSGCSRPCGGGTQTRTVTQQPANGGAVCPILSQACNTQACPVDCQVSGWSGCSKPCGGGTQTRTVTQQPANGGAGCPTLSQACNTQACPVDCQVSGWNNCSKPCGGGSQTRTVTQQPANGGAGCPPLSQTCNTQACPIDCQVSGWSGCSKPCGGGTQTRTVTQQPANGGAGCPTLSQSCNTQACPVDCQVSGWSGCSKPCGGGTQTRTVTQQPANGGAGCPTLSQSCNTQACPPSDTQFIAGGACVTNKCATSGNGVYTVCQQGDGNLVIYKGNTAIWANGKYGNTNGNLCMQNDGNLVGYTPSGTPYWASGTYNAGRAPYRFMMQNDGNLVIYDASNRAVWASGTSGK